MAKLSIELLNDYFIDVDEMNHTLKKRYVGKDKDGAEKETEKVIGYFPDTKSCVERIVRLIPLDENDGAVISMREYAEMAENAYNKVNELQFQ